MSYILILWLSGGAFQVVEFKNELSCELALAAVRKEASSNYQVRGVCVAREVPL